MLTIGGFARLSGVSAKVLRAYDVAGLFAPAWVDPSTAYRYYSAAQLPELRRILALREVGIGLAEIGRLVSGRADLGAALKRRRDELEGERELVERRLAALDIRVALSADGSDGPDVVVRRLETEEVATFDLGLQTDRDVGAAFYQLETHVRDLGVRAHRPPGAIDAGSHTEPTVIFVPVRRPIQPTDRIGFQRLPGGRAVTLLHRGPYRTLAKARRALVEWAASAGEGQIAPIRTRYLQFGAERELRLPRGWVVDRDAEFVTELQLPVA